MALTASEWIILLTAVAIGSTLQGALGFGLNVVVAPIAALIDPDLVPAPLLLVGTLSFVAIGWAERRNLSIGPVLWVLIGRLPGVAIAVWLLTSIDRSAIETLFGVMLLVVTAMSLVRRGLPATRSTMAGAGLVSGITGTTVSVGGPPVALALSSRTRQRSDITSVMLAGTAMSLGGLVFAGEIGRSDLGVAAGLTPAMVLGLLASRLLIGRLDPARTKLAIHIVALVAAVVLLVRGLS